MTSKHLVIGTTVTILSGAIFGLLVMGIVRELSEREMYHCVEWAGDVCTVLVHEDFERPPGTLWEECNAE